MEPEENLFIALAGLDQHQSVHGGQGGGGHPQPEGHLKVFGLVPRQQVQTPQDEINPRVQRQTSGRTDGVFWTSAQKLNNKKNKTQYQKN